MIRLTRRTNLSLNNNQKAFTIIELLIASTVFAVVLILMTVAMIQIGRTYYKGITTTRTQEVAREIIDDVSRQLQYSGGTFDDYGGSNDGYCIGQKLYSYALDQQVVESSPGPNQSRHALVVNDEGPCAATPQDVTSASVTGRELLAVRMRLGEFTIEPIGGADSSLYRIVVRVISGDNTALTPDHMSCKNETAGSQFCAVSRLSTVVQKRL